VQPVALAQPAGRSSHRAWLLVAVLVACGVLVGLLISGATIVALLVAAAPFLVFAVLYELEHAADANHPPVGLIALVLLLPFFQLALNTGSLQLAWQTCTLVVVLFYIVAMKPTERSAVVKSVVPLIVAFAALSLTGAITLFITGALDAGALLSAGVFGLSAAYLLVGSMLRTWAGSAERAARILIYGGLLQLPVVVAQATGLTLGLGGTLSQLSSLQWGGSIAAASLVRYPGSFGDYELFAEWIGILFILAVGGVMYTRGRTRSALAVSIAVFLCMGLLTATRGFLVAVGLAAVVVVPGALLSRRGRSLTGLLTTGVAVIAAFLLVPETAVKGSMGRLLQTTLTGANAFNRAQLWTSWGRLVERMPWYGLGWGSPALESALVAQAVGWPHSLYFYFALTAGWPGVVAIGVFVGMVVLSARGRLAEGEAGVYRMLVLGVAVVYWASSEAKIEFVRWVFYGDLLLVLFGIVAADRWLSRVPANGCPVCEPADRDGVRK